MSKDNRMYVMRHGQTEWNLGKKLQGRKDSPLTSLGKTTAQTIAQHLQTAGLDMIYCSPLPRCIHTAEIVGAICRTPFHVVEEMVECNMGFFEGKTLAMLHGQYPDFFMQREQDKWNTPWPDGESYRDVYERASLVASKLPQGKTILTVGHEMFNKCFIGVQACWSPERILAFKQANTQVYVVESGAARLFMDGHE